MPSSRQVGRIAASMPREISEYSICRSQIGCTARGAPQRLGAHLRKADMAHIAGLHHVGDGADRLLDRHAGIEPRGPIDVDVVDAEALQRIGQEILHRRRPRVDADQRPGGIAQRAELDADDEAVARHALAAPRAISISLWPMP